MRKEIKKAYHILGINGYNDFKEYLIECIEKDSSIVNDLSILCNYTLLPMNINVNTEKVDSYILTIEEAWHLYGFELGLFQKVDSSTVLTDIFYVESADEFTKYIFHTFNKTGIMPEILIFRFLEKILQIYNICEIDIRLKYMKKRYSLSYK